MKNRAQMLNVLITKVRNCFSAQIQDGDTYAHAQHKRTYHQRPTVAARLSMIAVDVNRMMIHSQKTKQVVISLGYRFPNGMVE